MKNLIVHRQYRRRFSFRDNVKDGDQLLDTYPWKCAVNTNNGDLYVLLGTRLITLPADRECDVNILNIAECKDSKVVGLEYCITTQQLYCAYDNGDIATFDATSKYSNYFEFEVVASFDSGLQCMRLSPDHEIITAVTGSGTVVTMVSDFQVISEVDLYSSDFGEKQFITAGWGKKDTQFHGSEGKTAAKAKPEQVNANDSDDSLPRITWRGDGTLFAVSFLHAATKVRQFKIFNREGILQYTSEPTNGLEECLAWKPSGSLIAAPQKLINKLVVALFEKNGLKHREFSLPFGAKEVTVKDLFWSPDSDVLAVVCKQSGTENITLQLWTENNCHWYLKQTLNFLADNPLVYATWSPTGRCNEKELIIVTLREIIVCSFNWCVNRSRGSTVNDNTVVAVIDGRRILITCFREKIIPPPMAQQCLELEEPINAIVFAPDVEKKRWVNSNIFCAVSCNNTLIVFKQKEDSPTTYEILHSYQFGGLFLERMEDCSTFQHFLWLDRLVMLYSKTTDSDNLLCMLSLENMFHSDGNIYTVDEPIEHIVPAGMDAAYVITNKSVLKFTVDEGLVPTSIEWKESCCHVEVVKIGTRHFVVALSRTNRFLIDGEEVANNVASFYVHSAFLLLTTLQHTLICVPLDESGMERLRKHDLTVKPWEHNGGTSFADISIGRVERGSYIIAAIPQSSKTIFQMPRGNLECIEPRPLLLHIVGLQLDNCDYRTAIDLVRKHHINPNLIHDHNPQLFTSNAEKFVEGNGTSSWLCRFLSELQDEDVTTTMYASCYRGRRTAQSVPTSDRPSVEAKIDKVCRILRDIMEKRDDASELIQPILLSLMKNKQGAGLQLALEKFKKVKAAEEPAVVENAFGCLQLATNTRVLYDTALGMYECELAMFIASKSQMDPKEYIPFLRDLRKLEENRMKYSIDLHLRRYESALVHLSRVPGEFEECLGLIRDHNLHARAMRLFERGSAEYKRVAGAYGEHLSSKSMYPEAAVMFCRSGDLEKALDANMAAGDWQGCIVAATKLNLSPTDLRELYREIVKRLTADRKYEKAAEVLRYYLNDAEEAVALLCEGRYWKHAIRIAHDVRRLDLNDTHIVPGVKEHAEHAIARLRSVTEDFVKHKSRLTSVRAEISAKQSSPTANDIVCHDTLRSNGEVTDFLSDASSVAGSVASQKSRVSTTSGRSYRSSKNRRKQERKLFSLKEGSMFEDLGLIHALYEIVSNACKRRDEWSELVEALVHFEFDDRAAELRDKMRGFFKLVEVSKAEIWDRSAPTSLSEMEKMAIYAPAQLQEVTAHLKLVDMYITHPPPEASITPCILDIF
ncbi:PREDICTED: elongator complex protein 1 [Dinoponera quadriceps]|uniref:Elongator complex protein 1 n=1 Tax=Dinoponera quadriceps TaxID=609295 RepID=A0A6P3WQT8_DINQU|nr:PREDICTED: elongator complex protein 1 [Dinoponera quadriceps]